MASQRLRRLERNVRCRAVPRGSGGAAGETGALPKCLALLATLLTATPALAAEVRVSVGDLQCSDPARVAAQIQRELETTCAHEPGLILAVDAPKASQVRVHAKTGQTVRDRTIDFEPRDCPELPETIAMLVRRWLDRRWSEPPALSGGIQSLPEPLAGGDSETPAAPSGPAAPASPPPAPAAPAGRAAAEALPAQGAALGAPSPRPAPRTPGLRAVLSGGLFAGAPDGRSGAAAGLAGEWDFSDGFGLALLASGYGPVTGPLTETGRVSVSAGRLSALARASVRAAESASVDLLAGAGVCLFVANSSGIKHPRGNSVSDISLLATARWRQRLVGGLSAVAGLEVDATFQKHRFYADYAEADLVLSPVRSTAYLGLSVELF